MEFQFGQHFGGGQDRVGVFTDAAGHLQQNPVDFRLFFVQQPDQFVILLDGFEGFDKNRLPAGTRAVDYALHPSFLFNFHGDNEPLAADRNQFVLQCAAFGKTPQIAAQRFLNQPFLLFDLSPDARQFRRRAVVECAIRQDFVAEETQELGKILNRQGERCDRRPLRTHCGGRLFHNLAPFGGAVYEQNDVADLRRL